MKAKPGAVALWKGERTLPPYIPLPSPHQRSATFGFVPQLCPVANSVRVVEAAAMGEFSSDAECEIRRSRPENRIRRRQRKEGAMNL